MPTRRLAHLREEIWVIDQERHRVATNLATVVSALDTVRTEMFNAFSALRRMVRVDEEGQKQYVRRDDTKYLRDAYDARKREWGAVVQRERELRARLTVLDAGKTDRLREHRRIYQSLTAHERQANAPSDPDRRPRESA